jgi:pSer/pThr/pTyr-binding forkhead associated (FHA) protein
MASIIITTGRKAGKFYPLGQKTHVVGRDENLVIQIANEFVSRKHAELRYKDETELYYVADLNSRHGTYVNGNRIYEEVPLAESDLVDIGGVTLMFTRNDFANRDAALSHYRETEERLRGAVAE